MYKKSLQEIKEYYLNINKSFQEIKNILSVYEINNK